MILESIESNLVSIGFAGYLIGFAIKKLMKILSIVIGSFLAALLYLPTQKCNKHKLGKLQKGTQSIVTTLPSSISYSGQLSSSLGNLGIPLTGGLAAGFAFGFMKG